MIDSIEDIVNISRPILMVLKYTAFESVFLVINRRKIEIITSIFNTEVIFLEFCTKQLSGTIENWRLVEEISRIKADSIRC